MLPLQTRVLRATALVAVTALAVAFLNARFADPARIGADFYQYWGVGQVIHLTNGQVRNPYLEQPAFNAVLFGEAARSQDLLRRRAAHSRQDLELQATPNAYLAFSWLGSAYTAALDRHLVAQILAFVASVLLLLSAAHISIPTRITVAGLLIVLYDPVYSEMTVGNFNTMLLLGLAIVSRLAGTIERTPRGTRPPTMTIASLGIIGILGGLTSLKPSLGPTLITMSIFVGLRLDSSRGNSALLFPILGGSAVLLGMIAAAPMIYFDTAAVWSNWIDYFHASNLDMYNLPFEAGNFSSSLVAARRFGIPVEVASAGFWVLVVSLLVLVAGRHGALGRGLQICLADSRVALSLGVTLFFATSPLAWVHYHLLLLAPALLVIRAPDSPRSAIWLSVSCLCLAAVSPLQLLEWVGVPPLAARTIAGYSVMLAWPMLWLSTLRVVDVITARKPDPGTA